MAARGLSRPGRGIRGIGTTRSRRRERGDVIWLWRNHHPARGGYLATEHDRGGGLLEFKKIRALAQQANVSLATDSLCCGPGLAATLHLLAASPGCLFIELPAGELEAPLLKSP